MVSSFYTKQQQLDHVQLHRDAGVVDVCFAYVQRIDFTSVHPCTIWIYRTHFSFLMSAHYYNIKKKIHAFNITTKCVQGDT